MVEAHIGSVRAAARIADESERVILYRIANGRISATKVPGLREWIVDLDSVEDYVERRQEVPGSTV